MPRTARLNNRKLTRGGYALNRPPLGDLAQRAPPVPAPCRAAGRRVTVAGLSLRSFGAKAEPRRREIHDGPHHPGGRARPGRLAPGRRGLLEQPRRGDRAPQLVDLDPGPAAGVRRLDGVERGGRQPAAGWLRLQRRSAVLARGPARALGRDAAHLLQLHGPDLRWPPLDRDLDRDAPDPGGRHRLRRPEPGHPLLAVPAAGAALRLRRWQFRLLDGQHQLFLSQGEEGAARWPSTPGSAISASAWSSWWSRW